MKIAYVDEAGVQASDAHCVVAGVIIDPDKQYQRVRARLDEIKQEHADYIDGEPFDLIFHAKDIYHGTKKFHRDRWPFEVRMRLLEVLANVISDFSLPFVVTAIERAAVFKEMRDKLDAKNLSIGAHGVAYSIAAMALEAYMRSTSTDEMAQLVCENNNEMRSRIRSLHNFLAAPVVNLSGLQPGFERFLPLGRIIDTVHFVEKTESGPLQLADLCAWVTFRRTIGCNRTSQLAEIIGPHWVGPSIASPS